MAPGEPSGTRLGAAAPHQVQLQNPKRLVYSPHSYGPAIYDGMGYFQDETFPKNMPKVWDEHAR